MKRYQNILAICSAFVLLPLAVTPLKAASFEGASSLSSTQFEALAKDLTAVLTPRLNGSQGPLGLTGFDIGLSYGVSEIKEPLVFDLANPNQKTTSGNVTSSTLFAYKGLPFGIDLGASLHSAGGYDVWGVSARYAILGGGLALPSVVARIATHSGTATDKLSFSSNTVDLSIAKGFLFIKPYAGVGYVSSQTKAGLLQSDQTATRSFIGAEANFLLLSVGYEFAKTGDVPTHALKASLKF